MPQQEELQCGGNRTMKARGASRWWQKWELEPKLLSPPLLFFPVKKMTTMSLSSFLLSAKKKRRTMPSFIYFLVFLLQKK